MTTAPGGGAADPGPRGAALLAASLCVALVALAAYVATLLPGVGYGGDTAKFQFLGRVLGIGHPTGYPVYLLVNWAFEHLPIGSVAYRANLLSAVFAAAAAGLLVPALARCGAGWAAPGGALWFAFSYTFWSQAIVAEVYTLHLLYLVGALAALLAWGEARRAGRLVAFLLVTGLSFSHHLLMLTALPGFAVYLLVTDARALRRRSTLVAAGAGGLLGTLPYGYLFWRTAAGAPYLEGKVRDLGGLLDFVTGGAFRADMPLLGHPAPLGPRLVEAARYIALEWTPIGWVLVPLGFALLARRRPRVALLLGLVAAGDAAFSLSYRIPDYFVYLIPFYLASAMAAVQALVALRERLALRLGPRGSSAAAAVTALALAGWLAATNGPRLDRHGDTGDARATRAILDAVGQPAVIVSSNYDLANYLYYYLLADPGYRGREVYVVQHVSWRELRDYLSGSGRLRQVEEGPADGVPPGLPVFVGSNAAEFGAAGFALTPVAAGPAALFRLLPVPRGPGAP